MSYSVDELFRFEKTYDGYALAEYLKREDPNITELEIPNKYNGLPVVEIDKDAFGGEIALCKVTIEEGVRRIGKTAFSRCENLRSISPPASLREVGEYALAFCPELSEVKFKSNPSLGEDVFCFDSKLPPELILAGQTGSLDITRSIEKGRLKKELYLSREIKHYLPWFSHNGAFALAAQNDCFREVDAELLDKLIDYCVNEKMIEQTAYFLELKNRKFGFKKGGELDL